MSAKRRNAKKEYKNALKQCVKIGMESQFEEALKKYDNYLTDQVKVNDARKETLGSRRLYEELVDEAACERQKEDVEERTMKEIKLLGQRFETLMEQMVERNRAAVESELSVLFQSLDIKNEELRRTKEENRQLNEIVTNLIEVSDAYESNRGVR